MLSVVLVTVPDTESAERISRALLEKRLCACVNRIDGVNSLFWWQGRLDNATESLLVIKTGSDRYEELTRTVKELHPYEVPEIVALPMDVLNKDYGCWMREEMRL